MAAPGAVAAPLCCRLLAFVNVKNKPRMQLNIDSRVPNAAALEIEGSACHHPPPQPGCDTCLVGPKLPSISPPTVLTSSGGTCPVSMRTAASLFSPLTCNTAAFQHTNNGGLWGILSSSPRHCQPPRCDCVPENRLTTAAIKLCHAGLSLSTHGCKS